MGATDIICLIIFLTSGTIRLFKLIIDPLLLRDCAFYLRLAENWNKTSDYYELTRERVIVPPLPLWCIKTLIKLCGNAEISGRSLSIFLGGLIPVIGFLLTKKITNNIRISIVAAMCFIFHPQLVFYSTQPLRENFFILLVGLLLIAMVMNFNSPKTSRWLICGAIVGTAFFCRYEALEFIIVIVAEMAFLNLNNNKSAPFFRSICFFFLAFVLTSCLLLFLCSDGDYSFMRIVGTYMKNVIGFLT